MLTIDLSALTTGDPRTLRPGAVEAVRRLALYHDLAYYAPKPQHGLTAWLASHDFPGGAVSYYGRPVDKLLHIYETQHQTGAAVLIDADWRATADAFTLLASGEYAASVPAWREATTFLYGYMRLIAFGDGPVSPCGPLPAIAHIASWDEAKEVLAGFERQE